MIKLLLRADDAPKYKEDIKIYHMGNDHKGETYLSLLGVAHIDVFYDGKDGVYTPIIYRRLEAGEDVIVRVLPDTDDHDKGKKDD